MNRLDKATIGAKLPDYRSTPLSKFHWKTPERSYVYNTNNPPYGPVRSGYETYAMLYAQIARNPSTDPYGAVESRYANNSTTYVRRQFKQNVPGQAEHNRLSIDGSATYYDTTGLRHKFSPTMTDFNNARSHIPRATAQTDKYSDTHRTFPTAQARSMPVSRQPMTRVMPGLRDSSPMGRHYAPHGAGKVGPAFSLGALAVSHHGVKETLSAGVLSPIHAQSDTTHTLERDDTAESTGSFKVSSNTIDNESPYDKRYGHLKSGKITIIDEPTEARRKKIKGKESTAAKVLVSPNDNDLVLVDVSSEKEELTVLGNVDVPRGRTRTKQKHTDKTNLYRSESKYTRQFQLFSVHKKRGVIPTQESRYQICSGKGETDVEFNSNTKEQKNMANKRKLSTSDQSKINEHAIWENDEIEKLKKQRKGHTPTTTAAAAAGKTICDLEEMNDHSADSESVLVQVIHTKKDKKKKIKKKKKSKNTKYSKIHPIDDGSEPLVRENNQLNKIAAIFCVESKNEATIRRTIMQKGNGKSRQIDVCKEQVKQRRTLKKFEDIHKQIKVMVDDDNDVDNFRPGVWNCNFDFKKPTRSEDGAPVIVNAEHFKRTDDASTLAKKEKDRIDDDAEEIGRNVSCVSGLRNFLRRIFKSK